MDASDAPFSDVEIAAMTLIGESESLGEMGMSETMCVIVNRAKANLHWMGGGNVRNVCLAHGQFDVWWPPTNNADRERVLNIATDNPLYGPYVVALGVATTAIAGNLPDTTNGAVSYYDSDGCAEPAWAKGKTPCHVNGSRLYYDLAAITGKPNQNSPTETSPSPSPSDTPFSEADI